MPPLTERRPSTEERVSRSLFVQPRLATKADVAESEARITRQIAESEARTSRQIVESEARTNTQIAGVRAEIVESEARTNEQIAALRDEMAKFETRMIRWMLTSVGFGIAAITVMYRLFG